MLSLQNMNNLSCFGDILFSSVLFICCPRNCFFEHACANIPDVIHRIYYDLLSQILVEVLEKKLAAFHGYILMIFSTFLVVTCNIFAF